MAHVQWNEGYAVDQGYTINFDRDLSPEHLNYVCCLHGVKPVPLNEPFTYFELGCGHGLSVTVSAACYPQGQFYANDFMPAHIASAQALAARAGLENLHLLECSFAQLAQGEVALPQFDFITLQGVYTWVSAQNQAHIVNFLARYLKPGGVVYVTYNALPGWAGASQLQHLVYAAGQLQPHLSSELKLEAAKDLVHRMVSAQSRYFETNPNVQFFLNSLHKDPSSYLIHEYLNSASQPKYHAQVAAEFAPAKLEFLASVNLNAVGVQMQPQRQAILDDIADPVLRITVEDFMLNTTFRKDIFLRGKRLLLKGERRVFEARYAFALTVPATQVVAALAMEQAWMHEALAQLSVSSLTLCELARLAGGEVQLAIDWTTHLHEAGYGAIFMQGRSEEDSVGARRLNRAIAQLSCFEDQYPVLASPLLGTGIKTRWIERLVYAQLVEDAGEPDAQRIATAVWAILQSLDVKVGDEPAAFANVLPRVEKVLDSSLPLWVQHQMI